MSDSVSAQPSTVDARVGPRVNVGWRARIVLGPQSFQDARVVNLSEDGLGLVCEQAYRDGHLLNVVVAMPDPNDRSRYVYPTFKLKVVFHVVSGHKFRTGTRLLETDGTTRQMLLQWIKGV